MKEIVNSVWNAPKEQVESFAHSVLFLVVIAMGIALLIGILIMRKFRKESKKFDKDFKGLQDRFDMTNPSPFKNW